MTVTADDIRAAARAIHGRVPGTRILVHPHDDEQPRGPREPIH